MMINITQDEFVKKAKENNHTILDVRRPDECATGTVSNAIAIDFMDNALFLSEIEKLDKTVPYLIYCRSGNRSGQACAIMDSMGFSQTYNLIGGMMAWEGSLSIA